MAASRTASNFLVNIVGSLATLAVSVATVPVLIGQLGPARFGVLTVAWLLLGYVGFLDLGLARAAANHLARLSPENGTERSAVLATALGINAGFGIVGALLVLAGGRFLFDRVVTVPDELRPEIAAALPWLAALLPLTLMAGVAIGALEARERFRTANLLGVGSSAIGQIVPAAVAYAVSPSLAVVLPAAVLARGLGVIVTLAVVLAGEERMRPSSFRAARAATLLRYGGWVTVSAVVSPLLTSVDQFLIGAVLGVATVPFYAVPMNVVLRTQIVAAALSRTLFPAMSRADATEARRLGRDALATLGFGYAALCGPGILLAEPALALWLGDAFGRTAGPVTEILLVGAWVNGLAFLPYGLLQAQGRPDVTAKFHLAEALPFLAVLWLLTQHFGLAGAATAWTLRVAVDAAILLAASRLSLAVAGRLAAPAAALGAALVLSRSGLLSDWGRFGMATATGFALVGLMLACDMTARRAATGMWRRVVRPSRSETLP